ncbi:DUF3617 domain-containing protein [Aurantiacibacter aquimixticola]|uniref:DUF3617 family protein n=1 Tax=Aurantiacibacter aquimixticola TaxID=1958945 RepID=A0A419RQC1_9SPHN|nr:DUF3617 family protein [Aurantiacibacter aquimixticola]RJY07967.1 DUF3617 family protein [Aurantiacibacter aquimixticola]
MRPFHALPMLAAIALVACNNDAETELNDEALAAGEVDGVLNDNGVKPGAGEYATSVELIDFDAPGLDEATIAEARNAFAEGAGEPHLFCVTEETSREDWLSDMVEADCTLSRLTADDNSIEGAMQCSAQDGLNGRIEITGTSGDEGSDLRLTVPVETAAGEGTVRMRVQTNRVGDCG